MAGIVQVGPMVVAAQSEAASAAVTAPRRPQVTPTAPAQQTRKYGRKSQEGPTPDEHRGHQLDIRA